MEYSERGGIMWLKCVKNDFGEDLLDALESYLTYSNAHAKTMNKVIFDLSWKIPYQIL